MQLPHRHQKIFVIKDSQKGVDPLGIEPRTFRALKANHLVVKRTLMRILDRYYMGDVGCNILIPLDHESLYRGKDLENLISSYRKAFLDKNVL